MSFAVFVGTKIEDEEPMSKMQHMIPPSPNRKSYDKLVPVASQDNWVKGMFDINFERDSKTFAMDGSIPTEGLRRLAPFREHLHEVPQEG